MMSLRKIAPLVVSTVAALSLFAGGISQAQDALSEVQTHISTIENNLPLLFRSVDLPADTRATINERMAFYHVPGVSIAVIHAGQVEWSKGYGTLAASQPEAVSAETLFQAASISKPVTALAVLELVEAGKVDLDAPVNKYLKRWQIPDNSWTKEKPVTLRQLLSHTSGITVSGFPGYPQDAALPTLEQILKGEKPANSGAVVVARTPGTEYNYSGGGYTVVQLLVEEVTGMPFRDYMQSRLGDWGLFHSTFALLKPDEAANVAQAHYADGTTVPGGWYNYPESAAASLWTNEDELARLFISIAASYNGEADAPLSVEMAHEMVTPILNNYGLGLAIQSVNGITWVSHNGANTGYKSSAFISLENGDGVVILTNGDAGDNLAVEITAAVAETYGWSAFQRIHSQPILILDTATLIRYEGTYRFLTFSADLYVDDQQLYVRLGPQFGNVTLPLYFTSETDVVSLSGGLRGRFNRDKQGRITGLQTEVPGLGSVTLTHF